MGKTKGTYDLRTAEATHAGRRRPSAGQLEVIVRHLDNEQYYLYLSVRLLLSGGMGKEREEEVCI